MKKKTWIAAVVVTLLCASETVLETAAASPPAVYTHTVMVEGNTATWCGPCASAAQGIYTIYNSGSYDFHYVALVNDRLQAAQQRAQELGAGGAIPEYFFDGGYRSFLGWGGTGPYISLINECGARTAAHELSDVDVEVYADWEGGGFIRSFVYVTNNEAETYSGHLHVYVAEIESRWNTAGGFPYHYAMIGYAQNQDITIPPGGTYYRSTLWNGGANGFGDIELGNVTLIACAFGADPSYTDQTDADVATRVGDANGDGVVNVSDFLLMLSQWGSAGPEGDVNHDGIVDVSDFLLILSNWG
jgi:hypothetical protein